MEILNDLLSFLPEKLLGTLMQFQKKGVAYAIRHDGRCLIGDEMGLGKTLQALSIAYYYREEWPLLIIVPASLRYPWIDEVERWFPEIDPSHINLIQAGTDTSDIATSRITVVTYGLLRCPSSVVLQEALVNQNFAVVIADESHYLKNRRSQTSKYVVPLIQNAERRLLLTGTPALARPEELFPQVDAVLPGKFGSWTNYAKRYCNARWQHFGRHARRWVTDGASNLEELQSLLCTSLMIRRLKKDVLTELPPKIRQRVLFPIKDSVLKKDLDMSWNELETAMGRGQLGSLLGGEVVPDGSSSFDIHRLISVIYRKTAAIKIGPVKEYVKMLCENQGLKFIVFAHHHIMLDALSELLHDEEIPFIRIDGHTDQQARPHLVHEFQVDAKIRVALLSIKAAGIGITLTSAKLVMFAELDWTPGVLQQCEDRAHRIGQKGTVQVHYLVAKGTMDDWVWSALARKTVVVTTTLNGKRQLLRMEEGKQDQVDCLANADVWIPKEKADIDPQSLVSFFNTQQQMSKKQRSIAEFFTPKSTKRKFDADTPKSCDHSEENKRLRHTTADDGITISSPIVLSDSDDETDDFQTPKTSAQRRSRAKSSQKQYPSALKTIIVEPTNSSTTDVRSNWSCDVCTFLNHSDRGVCEMCSACKSPRKQTVQIRQNCIANTNLPLNHEHNNTCDNITISDSVSAEEEFLRNDHADNNEVRHLDTESSLREVKANTKRVKSCRKEHEISDDDDDDLPDLAITTQHKEDMLSIPLEEADISNFDINLEDCDSDWCADDSNNSSDIFNNNNFEKTSTNTATSPNSLTIMTSNKESLTKDSTGEYLKHANSWTCSQCQTDNTETVCSGCLEDKPTQNTTASSDPTTDSKTPDMMEGRSVDLDNVPVYERFQFCCSLNTSRIYLFDEVGVPLDVNFIPLDVEMDIYPALPDVLLHPSNMKLVKRFLREWSSLAPTKRRLIVKNGQVFSNPLMHYEELKRGRVATKQRFTSKADVASAAVSHAGTVKGSIRVLTRPGGRETKLALRTASSPLSGHQPNSPREQSQSTPKKQSSKILSGSGKSTPTGRNSNTSMFSRQKNDTLNKTRDNATTKVQQDTTPKSRRGATPKERDTSAVDSAGKGVVWLPETAEEMERMPGMVQALSEDGTPLCVTCQEPYSNSLVSEGTVKKNPWATRFCTQHCAEQFWFRRHGDYAKQQVFDVEHGICQMCKFDAQKFFERIMVTRNISRRAELIQSSKYSVLSSETKQQMVQQPKRGQFWQADHIQAVSEGGGECDIDNLRTLCTPCHRTVTAEQAKRRVIERRGKKAANCRNITAFFKPL